MQKVVTSEIVVSARFLLHRIIAQQLEECGIEVGIVACYMVVEIELEEHTHLDADALKGPCYIIHKIFSHSVDTVAPCNKLTQVEQDDIREEVVARLGTANHVYRTLMYVSYLMRRSPAVSTGLHHILKRQYIVETVLDIIGYMVGCRHQSVACIRNAALPIVETRRKIFLKSHDALLPHRHIVQPSDSIGDGIGAYIR